MKAISILRSDLDSLPCDAELLKILNNVCDTCNFIVSGHDCWFGVSAENDAARERFASTGLRIAGDALYSLMKSGALHFLSGVLSAVPKELKAYQLWDYVPKWETAGGWEEAIRFQTPYTQMEIVFYDGYLLRIAAREDGQLDEFLARFPKAEVLEPIIETEVC